MADKTIKESIEADSEFLGGSYCSRSWKHVHKIRVPELSRREQQKIKSQIGNKTVEQIHDEFGYLFADDQTESKELIESYVKHYRRCPSFTFLPT